MRTAEGLALGAGRPLSRFRSPRGQSLSGRDARHDSQSEGVTTLHHTSRDARRSQAWCLPKLLRGKPGSPGHALAVALHEAGWSRDTKSSNYSRRNLAQLLRSFAFRLTSPERPSLRFWQWATTNAFASAVFISPQAGSVKFHTWAIRRNIRDHDTPSVTLKMRNIFQQAISKAVSNISVRALPTVNVNSTLPPPPPKVAFCDTHTFKGQPARENNTQATFGAPLIFATRETRS
ncbi:hypothetical protein HPB51_020281 [Rhipicephalus microplus]|uniref:Uncharacterized protein n=1 Tax=Rhipicephalus microplus TaxID=6941 RepID=A0A9J6DCL1_RHIMP|nr:hypothetical protein HPB51_020281 [Rhipicephalus microplus]